MGHRRRRRSRRRAVAKAKVGVSIHRDSEAPDRAVLRRNRAGILPYTSTETTLVAAMVSAFALGIYLRTMLPGVGFWDTAEAQTVPYTLSIFHPTGFPLYALLGWAWSQIPIGEVAFRMNLLSGVCVALAAGLAVLIGGQLIAQRHRVMAAAGAGIGGLTFALADEPWDNALRADVHAVAILFIALVTWLLMMWRAAERAASPRAGRWLAVAALVFGLGLAVHPVTGLLAIGIAPFLLLVDPAFWRRWRLILVCAVLLAAGVATYLYIPIRGQISPEPPLFYGRPDSWEGVRYVIFAEQFGSLFADFRTPFADLDRKLGEARDILGVQFIGPGWLVAAIGAVYLAIRRQTDVLVFIGLAMLANILYAVNFRDGDIDRYYLATVLLGSALVGVAVAGMATTAGRAAAEASRRFADAAVWRRLARIAAASVMAIALLLPGLALVTFYEVRDRSHDHDATLWVESVYQALPQDAVVISWWSYSTPLWYHRWVLGDRPDVKIIDERNILDDGYGNWDGAIEAYLGERPVYIVPPHWRLDEIIRGWRTRTIPTYAGYARLLLVEGPRES
jgi:hypothetical protein